MELKSPSAKLIAPPPVWLPLLLLLLQLLPSSTSRSTVERPRRNIAGMGMIYRVEQQSGVALVNLADLNETGPTWWPRGIFLPTCFLF